MLIGYMRVSKADGSQVLDLQKDALLAAGVNEDRIYSDNQSGSRHDNRPGLTNCLKALQAGNTLYEYVNGDGSPKEPATKLLTGSIN